MLLTENNKIDESFLVSENFRPLYLFNNKTKKHERSFGKMPENRNIQSIIPEKPIKKEVK
jgi:hypothetical protein